MVNGEVYDFESIKITLPSGQITTAESIKYGWKRDVDVLTDKNGTPRGEIRKAGEGDFEVDMSLAQFERLNQSASATGILGMDPIPITVVIGGTTGARKTDSMVGKITEAPREWKKDSELRMTIKGKLTEIPKYNGIPAYIPRG